MLQKISTLFVALMMLAMMVKAQEHAILTPGDQLIPIKGKTVEVALLGAKVNVMNHQKVGNIILKGYSLQDVKGTIDTISIKEMSGATFNVNFGMFDQDVMIQWYVAPADLIIKAVGFMPSDATGADNGVAVSIVGTNLTAADLIGLGAPAYWGYWAGDDPTWNNAVPFEWQASGDWVSGTEGAVAPWTTDLWSDFGDGYVVTPVYDPNAPAYNWVVLNDALGFEPDQINRGEIFGIAFKNNGVNPEQPDGSRIGLLSAGDMAIHPGFKYYSKGRLATDDQGWWARKYTWDVVASVDIIGDSAPLISDVDVLPTTLSTEARTVTANIVDDNPSGGDAGVASAAISYTIDGGTTWNDVPMTADGDTYSGYIPGQTPGTTVDYMVTATDVNGHTSSAGPWEYNIFEPVNSTLLVFNGYETTSGYPQSYYFGNNDSAYPFEMDAWSYFVLPPELVNHYTNIIEIATTGPKAINSDVIADWLEADGGHNYMLAGDEWLGAQSGWNNRSHGAGDFIFDVLGVNYEYNDINYGASGDQNLPSVVMPVEGTLLGGPLYTKFTEISDTTAATDTMHYNPYYEIGVTNWLDGVDFEADVEVDMKGIGADGNEYNIAGHRTLSAGNKIAFLAYDPLSLDATPYYWYGFNASAPQVKAALWFGVAVEGGTIINCGDADEDGNVYAYDAALTLQHSIGLITLSEQGAINANVDEDTLVSAFDAVLILRHVIGLPEPVATCFDSKETPWNLPKEYKNNINITTDNISGTTYDFRISGINDEDHILSLTFDVELSEPGEAGIVNIPDGYVTGINRIDSLHYRVGVINAEGLSSDDMLFRIDFAEELGIVTLSNVRLNGKLLDGTTGVSGEDDVIKNFKLVGNYPNPFNPTTKIAFEIPKRSRVEITIYNLLGQKVTTLVNREYTRGRYEVQWNARSGGISSGMYIVEMKAGSYRSAIKMSLLK